MPLINYESAENVTGFDTAFDHAKNVVIQQIGYDAYGALLLITIFVGFYVVSSRFTQDRALTYSLYMTSIVGFILTSGGFLDPYYNMILVIALGIAIFMSWRQG